MFWERGLFIPLKVKCTILFFILVHYVLISLNNHPLLCFKKTAAAILRMHSILSHLSQRHGMKYFNCFVAYSASLTLIFDRPKKKGGEKIFHFKITPFMEFIKQNLYRIALLLYSCTVFHADE